MSSERIFWGSLICLLLAQAALGISAWQTAPSAAPPAEPARLFRQGEEALNHGRLDEAERDFRGVLAADPHAGGAYANLGVVYMRRKQWDLALTELKKASQMMPQVAGIRLDIGLAYYRQNEFLEAILPFESVVHDQPDAEQPRYLLGLCYFFAERWADAATTLEPLWPLESAKFPYLYVISNAAHRAGRTDLDDRASAQLAKLGDGSAEYYLFVGKYHLNLEQYDQAISDFRAAEKANAKLPFVHFNLGFAYRKKQDYDHAKEEFLKDAAIEPDLALNYDQLGDIYWLLEDDANAEKSYREALKRDPRLLNSRIGLAKIYQRKDKPAAALVEADAAEKIDPARTDAHYLRGRILLQMGRKEEAKKELDAAVNIDNEHRSQREKQVEEGTVPSPELLQDPQ